MIRVLPFVLILAACGPLEDLAAQGELVEEAGVDDAPQVVQKAVSMCRQKRVWCEQGCFDRFGQTFGTLSPFYNACIKECKVVYEKCSHKPHRLAARKGYAKRATYSWDQPSSEGVNGYYGYCGPTAVSNLMMNLCHANVSPRYVSKMCFSWAPGTTPGNLVYALNELGHCGRWALCRPNPNSSDTLGDLARQLPVATLVEWEGALSMHWVTVVDIHRTAGSCAVVFNHWGRQERMECNDFIKRWSLADTALGGVSVASRTLNPFTYVCQTSPAEWQRDWE